VSSIAISLIVFGCVFGAAIIGLFLGSPLPEHHLSTDSKETVRLGMGLVATLSALVLGLLVASAKTFYDTQSAELTQMSADIVVVDRLLAQYGPEAKEARDALRVAVLASFDQIWPRQSTRSPQLAPVSRSDVLDKIETLSAHDDKQRAMKGQVQSLAVGVVRTRWLMNQQLSVSVSKVLLIVMVFWLMVVFFSFGLFSPRNATAIASLLATALSVSGAILLILEMYTPYTGMMQISSAPL
jgi:hypothetical protein